MGRHSKNATTRQFFTYDEKRKLGYGSKAAVLGSDSMKDFDACCLCLQPARDPLCCPHGDLFCKACIYQCLLEQKQEIKRTAAKFEKQQKELEYAEQVAAVAAEEEKKEEFRKLESDILPKQIMATLTEEERLEEEEKERKKAMDKQLKSLDNFWVTQNTPSAPATKIEKPVFVTKCPQCSNALSVKQLVVLSFTPDPSCDDPSHSKTHRYMCPSCRKTFTNGSEAYVLRKCGHAVCAICTKKFVIPSKHCFVCNKAFSKATGLIKLKTGGTGFAQKGAVTAKKFDHAFF